jgi:hypothetical protein
VLRTVTTSESSTQSWTGCELMFSEGLVHRVSGPLGRVHGLTMSSALTAQTYKRDDRGSYITSFVGGRVDSCFQHMVRLDW